jgi:hypothetical protein
MDPFELLPEHELLSSNDPFHCPRPHAFEPLPGKQVGLEPPEMSPADLIINTFSERLCYCTGELALTSRTPFDRFSASLRRPQQGVLAMHIKRTRLPMYCFLPVVLGLLTLLATSGCARTIQGRVLEAETGQPIAGAIVLGVWTETHGFGDHYTTLVGAREAETDAQGRFTLERVQSLFGVESVTVYKFGYITWSSEYVFPSKSVRKREVPPEIRLAPFPPGGSHWEHVRFIDLATSMTSSRGAWVKFREAIRQEERMK